MPKLKTAGVGPGVLCGTRFLPQIGRLDDAAEEWVRTDRLVSAATAGEELELPTAGTFAPVVDRPDWPVLVAPGVAVELSVAVGEGETVSVGDALGLEPWICPVDPEADGAAPEGSAGLHVAFGLAPAPPPEPRLDWPCALVPPPLPPAPPPAPPPLPVEWTAFDALGEIPC